MCIYISIKYYMLHVCKATVDVKDVGRMQKRLTMSEIFFLLVVLCLSLRARSQLHLCKYAVFSRCSFYMNYISLYVYTPQPQYET